MKIYENEKGELVALHSNDAIPAGAQLYTGEANHDEVFYYDGGFGAAFSKKGTPTWIQGYIAENWWCESSQYDITVVDGVITERRHVGGLHTYK